MTPSVFLTNFKIQNMKSWILTTFFTCLIYLANAQSDKPLDYQFIQKAFENDIFEKHFFIRKITNPILIVIDTGYLFQNCQFQGVYGKKIEIQHDLNGQKNMNSLVIYGFHQKGNKTILGFIQPINNGAIRFEFTRKGKHLKVKVLDYGVF